MKKFTKLFVGVFIALALTTSAVFADQTVSSASGPVVVQTVAAPSSLFNAGEYGLSISSAYNVGNANTVKADVTTGQYKQLYGQPYTLNFNAGAFYFPYRYLGFEANVPFYQSQGVSVDEVQAGVLLRLPLGTTTPILRNIALYGGGDAVYNWQTDQRWSYIGKAGVEFRVNSGWGVFTETQYRNSELRNWGDGSVSVEGGLRFVF